MTVPRMQLRPLFFRADLRRVAAGLALAAATGALAAQPGASPGRSVAPSPTPVAVNKAVFVNDTLTGRDPFFPASQRRRPMSQASVVASPNASSGVLAHLVLKGIALNKDRRLALVNNATLAEGEKGPVRVNGQIVMLQCLEIRERSVLVSLEGDKEVKELRFAKEI